MKLIRAVENHKLFPRGVVATIGNFDGVHRGHQHLLKTLRIKADNMNLPLVLILFEPQPKEYFQKELAPARLSSFREKVNALKFSSIDYIYCIRFDTSLANCPPADFVNRYLLQSLKVKYLLIGEDFRFGKNRVGDVNLLKTLAGNNDCEVATYADFCVNNDRVSSTKIRTALKQGDLEQAATLLGRPYTICGRVIRGDGRGRQWGIPTANLSLHRNSLPLHGVFVVEVQIGTKRVKGVANMGKRPTVDGSKNILEIHLFDFEESIYGTLLEVFFLRKLRDEVKFTTVDALITQIHNDIAAAKAFLNSNVQ